MSLRWYWAQEVLSFNVYVQVIFTYAESDTGLAVCLNLTCFPPSLGFRAAGILSVEFQRFIQMHSV